MVLDRFPFFAVPIYRRKINRIFRLTVNNRLFEGEQKRITELKSLRNPPKCMVTKLGRANFEKQCIFYGGFEPMTIMNELKPNVGDLITICEWKLITDLYLYTVPIFKPMNIYDNNGLSMDMECEYNNLIRHLPIHETESRQILLNFLTDCFAKSIDKNNKDYYLSAYFADFIFHQFENGITDCIIYPSVQIGGAFMNIAMKADIFKKNYEPFEVNESIITMSDKINRRYFMRATASSKFFEGENIIWNNY